MMDFETTMEEGGVLPKPKASERDYLMDFKPVTAQFEVPNKFKDLDNTYLQQKFNVQVKKDVMSWSEPYREASG